MRFTIFSGLFLAATALAAPLAPRQSSTTCGNNYYSSDQVNDALQQGYNDYQDGDSPDNYPHQYEDYEGFTFPVDGPYYEFPIQESGVYTGGKADKMPHIGSDEEYLLTMNLQAPPGADRVVFNGNGEYAGAITHTGASGNDFVGCSGTS